jgi:hypothetical protein
MLLQTGSFCEKFQQRVMTMFQKAAGNFQNRRSYLRETNRAKVRTFGRKDLAHRDKP